MNWKMNTLKVRLSSKSDCVRCISEKIELNKMSESVNLRYQTPQLISTNFVCLSNQKEYVKVIVPHVVNLSAKFSQTLPMAIIAIRLI